MEVNTTILTISILVAFSGWAKFLYDILTNKPKISGQIVNVIIGDMANVDNPSGALTACIVYIYLTNKRRNSVHILDYELEIDLGSGFEKLMRMYGVQNVKDWHFTSETHKIEIPDFNRKLIYAENKPVEYGSPLHGFVLFASKKPQSSYISNLSTNKYKVPIIDAFQNKHKIITSANEFPNLFLLQDLAGIKLTSLKK